MNRGLTALLISFMSGIAPSAVFASDFDTISDRTVRMDGEYDLRCDNPANSQYGLELIHIGGTLTLSHVEDKSTGDEVIANGQASAQSLLVQIATTPQFNRTEAFTGNYQARVGIADQDTHRIFLRNDFMQIKVTLWENEMTAWINHHGKEYRAACTLTRK